MFKKLDLPPVWAMLTAVHVRQECCKWKFGTVDRGSSGLGADLRSNENRRPQSTVSVICWVSTMSQKHSLIKYRYLDPLALTSGNLLGTNSPTVQIPLKIFDQGLAIYP